MHTVKFEVAKFQGDNRKRRAFFLELARNCQRVKNRVMQHWLQAHAEVGNVTAAWEYWDSYFKWQNDPDKKKGSKPRHTLSAFPSKSWQNDCYHDLRALFPGVHTRLTTLLVNKQQKVIKKRRSSNYGQLPGWLAILLGLESLPTFSHPQPVVFDKSNCYISYDDEKKEFCLWLKCEMPEARKPVQDVIVLKTKDRRGWKQVPVLHQLVSGNAELKGSQLVFRKGKWFVHLTVERPKDELPELNADQVAVVRPGRDQPWTVRMSGESRWRGGTGDHVGVMRQRVQHERRSRQNKSRWAPRRSKGRGRTRATASWQKLETRWHDYCEGYNHQVSTAIVRELRQRGIGKLVFSEATANRFLATTGNESGYQSSWPFFRFKTMLAYKCERAGIEFFDKDQWRKARPVKKKKKKVKKKKAV